MNPMKTRKTQLLALAVLTLAAVAVPAAAQPKKLDKLVKREMRKAGIPGLAAVIVVDGRTAWSGGYGWANIEEEVPVTPDTVFKIGSVAKTVTATAVMQLVDDGLIGLDADINDYLPFALRNPHHPEIPITARQLLTHTSSVSDRLADELEELLISDGDYPLSLEEFLPLYLLEDSDYFDPDASFHPWAPGEAFDYSNIGFALLGYLVERVSGTTFETFTQERLFRPLEMLESSWFLANLDRSHLAVPYLLKARARYQTFPFTSYAPYPSGMLQTSARQFGNFIAMHLESGRFEGTRILRRSSAREMWRVQSPEIAPTQGLAFLVEPFDGGHVVAHSGAWWGFSSDLFIFPERGFGIAIFTNSDLYPPTKLRRLKAMGRIQAALFDLAQSLAATED
ncbi:MAG: beta-lactamase family protein [Acidobacteriota bacterium]|nr:beta-lactamase family protein [Acidobacteriota bacterium]